MMVECLNVSCVAHDRFLKDVHANLRAVLIVRDDEELIDRLDLLAKDGCRFHTLDFISHSYTSEHLLKLGRWRVERGVTLDRFIARAKESVRKLEIRRLRLLACLTASSASGKLVLRDLEAGFEGVSAYGAIDIVRASNFDPAGFRASEEFRLARP
jgi:hypothetical protein